MSDIRRENIDFAFLYWPALDGLLHSVGNQSPQVPQKLRDYEKWIRELIAVAEKHYAEVRLYIFSDHGMANCDVLLDLKAKIEPLPLRMGKDYAVVYDSTMARFWFFNERARQEITAALKSVPQGRILPDAELKELRAPYRRLFWRADFFGGRRRAHCAESHGRAAHSRHARISSIGETKLRDALHEPTGDSGGNRRPSRIFFA